MLDGPSKQQYNKPRGRDLVRDSTLLPGAKTMTAANFEIVSTEPFSVTIRDLGPWDKHLSVTNDAEGVIKRLMAAGQLKLGQRLFYYDSDGDFAELGFNSLSQFTGFKYPR